MIGRSKQLYAGAVLAGALTACGAPKNNFVGTWQDRNGRAVIDQNVVAFYDRAGYKQGQWPIKVEDDRDATVDSVLGAGSLTLLANGTLEFNDISGPTRIYTRVSN